MLQLRSGCLLPASFQLMRNLIKDETTNHDASPDSQLHAGANNRSSKESASGIPGHQHIQDNTNTSSHESSRLQRCFESKRSPRNPRTQVPVTSSPPRQPSADSLCRKRKRGSEPSLGSPEMLPPGKRIASTVLTRHLYEYTRLLENEIRLFTLFPGEHTQRLQGMLWTTNSRMAGAYTTLSYVWGREDQPVHTLSTPTGRLIIRDSLHEALLSLRQRHEPLTLWIDALCINQEDKSEKAQQIALLAEIFQRSTSTLAFIGEGGDHSEAIQMLMQVRARMVLGSSSKEWPEDLPRCPPSWEERGMPHPGDEIWARVAAFFGNPWFRRAWIVQEAVIARRLKIVCGKTRIDWNHLFLVMDHIDKELETAQTTESIP